MCLQISTDTVLEARGLFLHSCRHASEATGSLSVKLALWLTPYPGATARQPEETWTANNRGMSLLLLMCVDLLSRTSEPHGKHISTLTQNIPKYTDINPCVDIYQVHLCLSANLLSREPNRQFLSCIQRCSRTQIRSWYIKRKNP